MSDETTAVPTVEEGLVEVSPTEEKAPAARPKRLALILLGVGLALTIGAVIFLVVQLLSANSRIAEQNRELDQQRELQRRFGQLEKAWVDAEAPALWAAAPFLGQLDQIIINFVPSLLLNY